MQRNTKLLIIGMWAITGIAAVGLGGTLLLLRSGPQPAGHAIVVDDSPTAGADTLPKLFNVPAFTLNDENGQPFSDQSLRGKVWVADFIFTHCPSLCPLMTRSMYDLQQMTAGTGLQLVSVSVDPERDTPPVLKQYATDNKADLSRWHFLTGSKDATWDLSKGMKLAVQPDRGSSVMHSSHFLLVDRAGHVRGVYDSGTAGFLTQLAHDAQQLQQEQK